LQRTRISPEAASTTLRESTLADRDPLDLELVHPLEGELRDLAALLHDDLAALGLRLDVLGGLLVGHEGTHVEPDLPILEGDLLDGVEIVEDILRRVAHGL